MRVALDEGHGVLQAGGVRVRAADGGRGRVRADRGHARGHADHLGREVEGEVRRDRAEIGLAAAAAVGRVRAVAAAAAVTAAEVL